MTLMKSQFRREMFLKAMKRSTYCSEKVYLVLGKRLKLLNSFRGGVELGGIHRSSA
jgi:hypothetical protein